MTHPDRNMRAITDRPYSIVCLLISLPGLVNSVTSVVESLLVIIEVAEEAVNALG